MRQLIVNARRIQQCSDWYSWGELVKMAGLNPANIDFSKLTVRYRYGNDGKRKELNPTEILTIVSLNTSDYQPTSDDVIVDVFTPSYDPITITVTGNRAVGKSSIVQLIASDLQLHGIDVTIENDRCTQLPSHDLFSNLHEMSRRHVQVVVVEQTTHQTPTIR